MAAKKKNTTPNSVTNINIYGDVKDSNLAVGNNNKIDETSAEAKNKEILFDAGSRLRQIREEIGLKSSEFVELLGLQSEKKYLGMEQQTEEVPLSLLEKLHETTGVSLEWLKHEKTPRFEIEAIYFRPIEEDLDYCKRLKPQEFFLTLEPKSLHMGLVAQTEKYTYQVIETGVHLDFWKWQDELWAIAAFYNFLKALSDSWHDIDGIILNPQDDKKLYDGEIHFLATAGKPNKVLLYDLLDIDETRGGVSYYPRIYGNWMHKVHTYFKKYLNKELERSRGRGPHFDHHKFTRKTIIFRKPSILPSYERAVFWKFPFDMVETLLVGKPEEIASTVLCSITVSISEELAIAWNLLPPSLSLSSPEDIAKTQETRENLKKILFWHAVQHIKRLLTSGLLKSESQLDLSTLTDNAIKLDPSRIPEPDGYKIEESTDMFGDLVSNI